MKKNILICKVFLLLAFLVNSLSIRAVENFNVNLGDVKELRPMFSNSQNPKLLIRKEDLSLKEGTNTKIKIDATDYFLANKNQISFPTEIKIVIYKRDLNSRQETWLRTSTKLVRSKNANIVLDLDLASFLNEYEEEFVFKLFDSQGNYIQEYMQTFSSADFNPEFVIKVDDEFSACDPDGSMVNCVYEALGTLLLKPVAFNTTENYIARNADGSLVMTVANLKANKNSKKNNKKKNKKSTKSKEDKSQEAVSDSLISGITKFSTITQDSTHFHGYTEDRNTYSMIATSWDPSHPYKNPNAYGSNSAVFGHNNKTSNASIIAGEDNFTTAYSAVFGRSNIGQSSYSLIAGQDNYVDSSYALVSGKNNEVENAAGSLVVGYYNDVNGEYSSVVGHVNKINGYGSHILGSGITVNGNNSIVFGFGDTTSPTVVTGDRKIAFVYGTQTLLLVDGVNGTVDIGSGAVGSGGGSEIRGTFNGTFIGDGSQITGLNPNSLSGVVPPSLGGTGIVNSGTFFWGASNIGIINDHNLTVRLVDDTDIVLPTTGTIATLDGLENLNNKILGPNLSIADGTVVRNNFVFEDTISFNGSIVVRSCNAGDFLLANAQGELECSPYAGGTGGGANPTNPGGPHHSIQFNNAGSFAGDEDFSFVNGNLNVVHISQVETLSFNNARIYGDTSFYSPVTLLSNFYFRDGHQGLGKVLVGDADGKLEWAFPHTILNGIILGSDAIEAAGPDNAVQFNRDGSLAGEVGFSYQNGTLVVQDIAGVESLTFSSGNIYGNTYFNAAATFNNELRLNDGNQGSGKILVGDKNGSMSWAYPSDVFNGGIIGGSGNGSSLEVAGNNGSIQFNANGVLAADHNRLQYTQKTLKAQAITSINMVVVNATGSATMDWSRGNQQEIRLTQNITSVVIIQNPAGPTTVMMQLVHNGNTGIKTINWPSNFKFSDGAPPVLSTQASAVDFVSCFYNPANGSNGTYYCQASYNFF